MGLIDLFITPFYCSILFIIVFLYKSKNKNNQLISKYFLSAFILRILGGVAFGCVYFFYYNGGDTFNYFSDSLVVSGALRNDTFNGFKLLFFSGGSMVDGEIYEYVRKTNFYSDPGTFLVARIAGIINLFTYDSYLSTGIIFSELVFS